VDCLHHHQQQDLNTSYSEFLATHLPVFLGAKDPLDADDWVRTTESKFGLLHYTEYQKTSYATQQLRGPVGAWWASYTTALPADHHLLASTMRHKLVEFLELHQGNHSTYMYPQEFNNMAQYSGHHVDNDAKIIEEPLNIQL
jgi:hypothetical protein